MPELGATKMLPECVEYQQVPHKEISGCGDTILAAIKCYGVTSVATSLLLATSIITPSVSCFTYALVALRHYMGRTLPVAIDFIAVFDCQNVPHKAVPKSSNLQRRLTPCMKG